MRLALLSGVCPRGWTMKTKNRKSFGGILNSILWEREMSMTDLADKIGAAKSTVFYWVKESRPPHLDVFARLADVLELDDAEVLELVNTFRCKK